MNRHPDTTDVTASPPATGPATRRRILVVDDEEATAAVVARYLDAAGHDVECRARGEEAIAAAKARPPDVVVLDLMLPDLDGIEVCRQLRAFSNCYVLMLSARVDEVDRLGGLGVGADDYVTKPFSPRELVARVAVMLRRPRDPELRAPDRPASRTFGALRVDLEAHEAYLDGAPVPLTPTEFALLAALAEQPTRTLTRTRLAAAVWHHHQCTDERLIDVHIGHLRHKLGDDPVAPRYIRTVRGCGYRMGDG